MSAVFAWENEKGGVSVTTCADGVDPHEEAAELQRRGLIPAGAKVIFDPKLPAENSEKWRIVNGRVVFDPTIPDPPHPRQALLDAIDGATTLAALKAAVREALR